MRPLIPGSMVALVAALSLGGTHGASEPAFMFPAIVMLRGGGANVPVVLTHAGATSGGNLSADTIAILYGSLAERAPKSADAIRRRPFIEVAEFFGVSYQVDSSGHVPASQFDVANHHSRIYLPSAEEPALWENPVVAPGGASAAFYELGELAIRALETRGFKVRNPSQGRTGSSP